MENMNEKSEKKHSYRQKSPNDFAKTVVIFVCVELIIVVTSLNFGIGNKPRIAPIKIETKIGLTKFFIENLPCPFGTSHAIPIE